MGSIIVNGFGDQGGGGGGGTLQITSVIGAQNSVALNFNANIVVTGNASDFTHWSVIPFSGGIPVVVRNVMYSGSIVTVGVSEGTIGETYQILIPQGIIRVSDGSPLVPPFIQNFTSGGQPPVLIQISPFDSRIFDVVFSEEVNTTDALRTANYVIFPTLPVINVIKYDYNRYRIFTNQSSTPGQSYTLTVSNIRDLAGNFI